MSGICFTILWERGKVAGSLGEKRMTTTWLLSKLANEYVMIPCIICLLLEMFEISIIKGQNEKITEMLQTGGNMAMTLSSTHGNATRKNMRCCTGRTS